MPAPPEFGDAAGDVGVVEIFREIEAEDPAQTDGHVAVPGEVKVNVQHVGGGIEPEEQDGLVLRGAKKLAELAQGVCKQHLFAQTQHEAADALGGLLKAAAAGDKLLRYLGVADNGACDQLGEQGDVCRKIDEILLRRPAPVHVHRVADELKGVKTDADGQSNLQQRDGKPGDGVEIFKKEIRVFEKAQDAGAEKERQNQKELRRPPAPVFLDQQAGNVAAQNGEEHQKHIARLAPGIEKQAGKQQNAVF